jgi:hypothetical protein
VKTPFHSPGGKPLLSPLVRQTGWKHRIREGLDRLPPAAAPIAFTLVGGIVLVAVVASLLAGDPAREEVGAAAPVAAEDAAAPATDPETAATAAEPNASPSPRAEADTPAAVTIADLAAMTIPDLDPPLPSFDAVSPDDRTASIPPAMPGGAFVPLVEVAETAEELETLEAIQREEVAEDVGEPSLEETAAIPSPDGPRVPATTTKWVNMRSGPSDDAEVLEVVPALAAIEAESACDWCAVSYEGRDGYIYKTFLSYGEAEGDDREPAE